MFKSASVLNDIISSTDTLFGYFGKSFYECLSLVRNEFKELLQESEEIEEAMEYFSGIYDKDNKGKIHGILKCIMPEETVIHGEDIENFAPNLEKLRKMYRNLQDYEKEQIKNSKLQ